MLRRAPFLSLALLALAALPAAAQAAVHTPRVTKITPHHVRVGDTLTIKGQYFVSGRNRNTVIFLASGKRPAFVKAYTATTRTMKVRIPDTLTGFLATKSGQAINTRFRIRVLSRLLSRSFTATKVSPLIGPADAPVGPVSPVTPDAPAPCTPASLPPAGDADGDLLSNAVEKAIGTDPCNKDTDLDGVEDGFEYRSALDLNSVPNPLPYPGKRPYPNPLDPSDNVTDYDGDGLTQAEEYSLWADPRYGNHAGSIDALALNYSDGKQATQPVPAPSPGTTFPAATSSVPALAFLDVNRDGTISAAEASAIDFNGSGTVSSHEVTYMDFNGDGTLSDDEKDADGDGLTNYDEAHAWLNPEVWKSVYANSDADLLGFVPAGGEIAYPITYAQPSFSEADSDGDGVVDGLDDQDLDGVSNLMELSRVYANMTDGGALTTTHANGWVDPFNPCLPHNWKWNAPNAPDCMLHPPLSNPPTPFTTNDTSATAYAVRF